mmetsp:Transcript_67466/g.140986  ORF Transcript_67466/g.140986 Transcript_67466/m.140986 type:complete len:237 (-) Transcript_67466:473-1183(-)|eukprot:CAMPEP_0206477212 /NCGR_PEP_ID=MMETSP0324_2-20121206/35215_1 /ASSEMBLY_ACC=CAM_ASM_000836 /TAXON_ID=2866 /ORGANISM="Crypthecodinium cohnii, Strain Seligo" /LENGTH=236 /DNA_ID=CAMNT_0053953067 /DNA_START=127 /DNA_END=837 /DNA_ORIENTATION=-
MLFCGSLGATAGTAPALPSLLASHLELEAISGGHRGGQKPEEGIGTQNSLHVVEHTQVVAQVSLSFSDSLLTELDSRRCVDHQPTVEAEEERQQDGHDRGQRHRKDDQEPLPGAALLRDRPRHRLGHREDDEERVQQGVEDHEEEELVIRKSNTIRDPRTMMIHAEDARPADSAMVTSVGLVLVTPLAEAGLPVSFNLVLMDLLVLIAAVGIDPPLHLLLPNRSVWHGARVREDCS